VVVEDIHEDPRDLPVIATNPCPALADEGMGVRESIDYLVLLDASQKVRTHPGAVPTLDEVREQVAQAKLDVRIRQEDVSQPVQDTSSDAEQ